MPSRQRHETLPERPGDSAVRLIKSAVAMTALRAAVSWAFEGARADFPGLALGFAAGLEGRVFLAAALRPAGSATGLIVLATDFGFFAAIAMESTDCRVQST